jgi:hypothetical protein
MLNMEGLRPLQQGQRGEGGGILVERESDRVRDNREEERDEAGRQGWMNGDKRE